MRLETTSKNLRASMALANLAIEKRNTIPVLGMTRIKNGMLTTTTLDMSVHVRLPVNGETKGEAIVDLSRLGRIAKHLPDDDDISLDVDKNAIAKFNGSEYRLSKLPVEDFPDINTFSTETSKQSTGNYNLMAAIRNVRFAVSDEETCYYLNGVCLSKDADGKPVVVATDGHRLAYMPLSTEIGGQGDLMLPKFFVDAVLTIKPEPQSVSFDGATKCRFSYPGIDVETKLIDGTFPDWLRVVPRKTVPYVTFKRVEFLQAIRRLREFNGTRNVIKVQCVDGCLILSIDDPDLGSGSEILNPEIHADDDFVVGYNSKYLQEVLTAFSKSEFVTFAAPKDEIVSGPVKIIGDNTELVSVLMPMRV